jgi:hypothetical protein
MFVCMYTYVFVCIYVCTYVFYVVMYVRILYVCMYILSTFGAAWNYVALFLSNETTATRHSSNRMEMQMFDPVLYPENIPGF